MTGQAHRFRAAARRRSAEVRGRLRSLASTRRTSLREVRTRRPPLPDQLGRHGQGSVVVPPGEIDRPGLVALGAGVLLHEGVSILLGPRAERVEIGDGTVLARYAHIGCAQRVTIGSRVSSSDHVAIVDTWGPLHREVEPPLPTAPVVIGDGAYLGFGCIIGPGVTVGEGAFVGEGAVVLEDVPAHSVVYGNPAQVTRHLVDGGWTGARFP